MHLLIRPLMADRLSKASERLMRVRDALRALEADPEAIRDLEDVSFLLLAMSRADHDRTVLVEIGPL
jgi:hypothetical protein